MVFNVSSIFNILLGQREVIRSLEFSIGAMEIHRRQVQDLLDAQKALGLTLLSPCSVYSLSHERRNNEKIKWYVFGRVMVKAKLSTGVAETETDRMLCEIEEFVVLAVQLNSLKLPILILGSMPFCLTGWVGLLFVTGFPLGATVIIGILVVLAAVNAGVLLFTYARGLQNAEDLTGLRP